MDRRNISPNKNISTFDRHQVEATLKIVSCRVVSMSGKKNDGPGLWLNIISNRDNEIEKDELKVSPWTNYNGQTRKMTMLGKPIC